MSMISLKKVLDRVASLLPKQNVPSREIGVEEERLAKRISNILIQVEKNQEYDFEEDEEVVIDSSASDDPSDVVFEPLQDPNGTFLTYEYCLRALEFKQARPSWSFESFHNRFRLIRNKSYIPRMIEYVQNQGTFREKMQKVTAYVAERFNRAREDFLCIHDEDIKRWAIEKAREINCTNFKGSVGWIAAFKKSQGLASRRVTKFITRVGKTKENDIERDASAKIVEIVDFCKTHNVAPSHIFNADESGIKYEEHRARTLSYVGEKNTQAVVEKMNATTHSYTIMPVLSMDGVIHSPALICLQEPTGEFGPRTTVPQAPNLLVTASKSGKLDKNLMRRFVNEVYCKISPEKSILLLDSWTGHKDESLYQVEGKTIQTFFIPEGATSLMQPLDVYTFRQWKDFVKRFQERVILDRAPINLQTRESIITMNSLILNQFQSPLFRPMFCYAWANSGFPVETVRFEGLKEICFEPDQILCNQCSDNRGSFIQCSWQNCRKCLCLKCFFEQKHFHSL